MANEAKPCPCDIGDRMEYGGLGQEVQIEHIKAYVVKPSTVSDKAIIVIQDIFGWQLPNTRYMADMLATNGYMYVNVKEMASISNTYDLQSLLSLMWVLSLFYFSSANFLFEQCPLSRLLRWKRAMESIK